MQRRGEGLRSAAVVFAALLCAAPAAAQQNDVPNALQGFARNRNMPVKIEAASLEVRDRDQAAMFSGNVIVQQGDTTMRSKQLVVHYDLNADKGPKTTTPAPKPESGAAVAPRQIKKLEASGGVVVTTHEQTATGDNGLFEMATNTVTLSGNVIMTQGPNVLRGERLIVNLETGVSRVESGRSQGGRVQGLFVPGNEKPDKAAPKPAVPAPAAPTPSATSPAAPAPVVPQPRPPMRLN